MALSETRADGNEIGGSTAPSFAGHHSLLACAIAGRRVSLQVGGTELAHASGQTIYLPEGNGERSVIGLVIQGALLWAGSFEPRILAHLNGRPQDIRRYLTLETGRAFRDLRSCLPKAVAAVVADHWQGEVPDSADESLARALSREEIPLAPEVFGTIHARRRLGGRAKEAPRRTNAQQSPAKRSDMPDDDKDDEAGEIPTLVKLFSWSASFSWFPNLLEALGLGRSTRPDGDGGGGEAAVQGKSGAEVSSHTKLVLTGPRRPRQRATEPTSGTWYPEWDCRQDSYRLNHCRVDEYDPPRAESDRQFNPQGSVILRRKLARVGLAYERHDRQSDGDSLDLEALVDFGVARFMGQPPDDRVYQGRLRTARDLGVLVLLDASGSTAEHHAGGTPVWDEQRQLAADLIATLEDLGDRVAAYAFNSRGCHMRFIRIKDFDGRFDQAALTRLAVLKPSGFTRLGAAVRHGIHMVATKAGTSKLLLILVSDGFPYDDDDYQGTYAEQDTHTALEEAAARGVGCACIAVASSTDHDALERVWGDLPHLRLGRAEELGPHAQALLTSALARTARICKTDSGNKRGPTPKLMRPMSLTRDSQTPRAERGEYDSFRCGP